MDNTSTTYRYQFGIAISEVGLNKISRALRRIKPNLFEKKTDIPIKAATDTEPAHTLTLYALVNRNSLFFDIYPLTDIPNAQVDTISVLMGADFSLTDNILGFITRIGITVRAIAQIQHNQKLEIFLQDFKVLKIEGKAPDFSKNPVKLIGGILDASAPLNNVYKFRSSPDKQLADSFTAIINYLIDLFLKDALSRPIVEFPVPDLSKIIKFGNVVFTSDEFRGPFLRNNSFYVMLGSDLGIPSDFPSELIPSFDLRTGLSKSGIERVASGILPLTIPVTGNPSSAFNFHTDNLQVHKFEFNIVPGQESIPTRIFCRGDLHLDIQFKVPIIGTHVHIPLILPLDALTHFSGSIIPKLIVDPYDNIDSKVHLHLIPALKFFDNWYLLVVTDYRDLFANAVREWVNSHSDFFILRILKKIPIIGWIIGKVIDMTGWAIGYLTGAFLDFVVSSFLTVIINTIGRAILSIFFNFDFDVFKLPQQKLYDLIGLKINSAQILSIYNGREGELEIRLNLIDTSPVSQPTPQLYSFDFSQKPANEPPIPNLPFINSLPVYTQRDFSNAIDLGTPKFSETSERFSVNYNLNGQVYTLFMSLNVLKKNDQWSMVKTLTGNIDDINENGAAVTNHENLSAKINENAAIIYDNKLHASNFEHFSSFQTDNENANILSTTSYSYIADVNYSDSSVYVKATTSEYPPTISKVALFPGIFIESSDFWIYRLAYSELKLTSVGVFGVISVENNIEITNWARLIPITIKSVADHNITLNNPNNAGQPIQLAAIKIIASNEEGTYEIISLKSGGLYSASFAGQNASVTIQSI